MYIKKVVLLISEKRHEMKIYTKKGDKGKTSLFGGPRVDKDDIKVEAYGSVDELNSNIGLLRDFIEKDKKTVEVLINIQDRLFTLGAILATAKEAKNVKLPQIHSADVTYLENKIDEMNVTLPEMKFFVLPGGNKSASVCHICRCVCRRAERKVVTLSKVEKTDEIIIKYLNRLSDYLFVLSRKIIHDNKATEIPWHPKM
jgi:cob(I)alamin adenosyltransferase